MRNTIKAESLAEKHSHGIMRKAYSLEKLSAP